MKGRKPSVGRGKGREEEEPIVPHCQISLPFTALLLLFLNASVVIYLSSWDRPGGGGGAFLFHNLLKTFS